MKQIFVSRGKVVVLNVPAPTLSAGTVLVRTAYSCISFGTESTSLQQAGEPLYKKVIKNPEKVVRVGRQAIEQGFTNAKNTVVSKLESRFPVGYSASGTVLAVDEEVEEFRPGDLVACAGANFANHAEIICVPKNLVTKVPQNLDLIRASTVTIGAIALQSVRRLKPSIGEVVAVIGLGGVGALVSQILKANGCRVIGVDKRQERIDVLSNTLIAGFTSEQPNLTKFVKQRTSQMGCDGVIIAASASNSDPVEQAMRLCRKKGTVVVVGDVGLRLERENFYNKEIDFLISTSYGPGRYDQSYELDGIDYPYAYVRWTEKRNMEAYLHLLSEKSVDLDALGKKVFELENGKDAFDPKIDRPTFSFFRYDENANLSDKTTYQLNKPKIINRVANQKIKIGVIGASEFAKSTHLPNLSSLNSYFEIVGVASRTSSNADQTAKSCGAKFSSTNYQSIIQDPDIDTVMLFTRHNLHAQLVIECLNSGKNVFVEKPTCMTKKELGLIASAVNKTTETSVLHTGFNRRHSQIMVTLREFLKNIDQPKMLNYVFNAGWLPRDHWVFGPEGGGRNIGEACHIYDLFVFLIDSEINKVTAKSVKSSKSDYQANDNFVTTVTFKDGSLCNLFYSAMGSTNIDKETLQVYCDGEVIEMQNYKKLINRSSEKLLFQTKSIDKGHRQQFLDLAMALRAGTHLVPFAEQRLAMEIAFLAQKRINN